MEEVHIKQFNQYVGSEGDYQDSSRKIREVYGELEKVCDELNDPIPVRF